MDMNILKCHDSPSKPYASKLFWILHENAMKDFSDAVFWDAIKVKLQIPSPVNLPWLHEICHARLTARSRLEARHSLKSRSKLHFCRNYGHKYEIFYSLFSACSNTRKIFKLSSSIVTFRIIFNFRVAIHDKLQKKTNTD